MPFSLCWQVLTSELCYAGCRNTAGEACVLCIIQYYVLYSIIFIIITPRSQQYKVTKLTPQQKLVARLCSGRNGSGGVRVEAPCIACMHMSPPVVARWSLRLSDSYGVRLSGATIPWALRAPARALWPRCMPAPVLHTTTRCAVRARVRVYVCFKFRNTKLLWDPSRGGTGGTT